MKITVRRDNDPFKKYWWVILLGFAMVGGWVCLPLMDAGTGGESVSTEQGLKSAEQSLNAARGGFQAPGSAVDLGMGGAYSKKKDGPITSSLYQAPPEVAAAGGPIVDDKSKLANALKDISSRKVSASADASGWGGEKAQRGFTAPKANFGSMSGLGSGGGGSGTSASASGGGGPAVSAFGSERPETGFATTRGLGEEGPQDKGGKAIMKSLESASAKSISAASQISADASRAMSGASFDGGGMGPGKVGGPGGGQSQAASGGVYANIDKAPVNLKMNDPGLSKKEIKPPEAKMVPKKTSMRDEIIKLIITTLIGGLVGGAASGVMGLIFPKSDTKSAVTHHSDTLIAFHQWREHGVSIVQA